MKKLKLLTIMAAATIVSASVYASPVFAADVNNDANVQVASSTVKSAEVGNVKVSVSEKSEANSVSPIFTITNTGDSDLNLKDLKLNYYYTADFAADATDKTQTFNCYYAGTIDGDYKSLTSSVKGTIKSADGENADSVLVLTFAEGTLAPGQSMQVDANVNKADWSSYDHSNDYSYDNSDKVVATINGTVVSGVKPGESTSNPGKNESGEVEDGTGDYGSENGQVSVSVSDSAQSNCVNPTFTVTNNGSSDLDLTTLNLKYYYTADFADDSTEQTFNCYYAGTTNGNYQALTSAVKGTISSAKGTNTDSVLTVSFTSGTLAAGQSMQVQANINKANWADYNHSNDYSYNNAQHIVATVNGQKVFGTEPTDSGEVNEPVHNSTLKSSSATFDKTKPSDITVGMNLNGNTLTSITGLNSSDYTINGDTVTIKQSAFANAYTGYKTLTFNFSAGNAATFTVNIIQSHSEMYEVNVNIGSDNAKAGENVSIPVNVSGIKAEDAMNGVTYKLKYDTNVLENVKVTAGSACANPTATFTSKVDKETGIISIFFADSTAEDKELLTNGLFFTLTGNIKSTAALGSYTISAVDGVFNPVSEAECKVNSSNGTVTVESVDPVEYKVTVEIGNTEGKNGDSVSIPVNVSGIKAEDAMNGVTYKLKYDTNVLENVKVTAGSACANPTSTFTSKVDKETGIISILFADSTAEDKELLTNGLFFTVTGNIKSTAAAGSYTISAVDGVFNPVSEVECTVNSSNGTVTVNSVPFDYEVTVEIGNTEGKNGDSVSIPVNVSGIKAEDAMNGVTYKLKYDTNVLENVKVTAGSACANPTATFTSKVDKETGIISILFADSTAEDKELLTNGLFFTVTGNIKSTAAAGSYTISAVDGVFNPVSEAECKVNSSNGTVTVNSVPFNYIVTVEIGNTEGKNGDSVSIPVNVSGIKAEDAMNGVTYKLKYDTNVLENVKVTAGSACANPTATFTSKVDKTNGIISILFADSTAEDKELLTNGLFFTVTGNIKSTAAEGSYTISAVDGVFNPVSEAECIVNSSNGTVTVEEKEIEVNDSTLSTSEAAYDLNSPADIQVELNLNGNEFTGIQGLTEGKDYVVSGTTVTIKQAYLDTLAEDSSVNLTFQFNQGNAATLKVTTNKKNVIEDDDPSMLKASFASGTVAAGSTIKVPFTISGDFSTGIMGFGCKIAYDSDVLEVVSVDPGEIITSPETNFKYDSTSAGKIGIFFGESSFDEENYIYEGGTAVYVTFKAKEGTSGQTKVSLDSEGLTLTDASFESVEGAKINPGTITIA